MTTDTSLDYDATIDIWRCRTCNDYLQDWQVEDHPINHRRNGMVLAYIFLYVQFTPEEREAYEMTMTQLVLDELSQLIDKATNKAVESVSGIHNA